METPFTKCVFHDNLIKSQVARQKPWSYPSFTTKNLSKSSFFTKKETHLIHPNHPIFPAFALEIPQVFSEFGSSRYTPVANLGDLAQRYTNDTFRSSWHRVMNLSQQPRFSVVCHGEMVV